MDGQKGCKRLEKYLPQSLLMTESEKRYGGSLFSKKTQPTTWNERRERDNNTSSPGRPPLNVFSLSLSYNILSIFFCFVSMGYSQGERKHNGGGYIKWVCSLFLGGKKKNKRVGLTDGWSKRSRLSLSVCSGTLRHDGSLSESHSSLSRYCI